MNQVIFNPSGAPWGIRKKITVKIGKRKKVARYQGRYFPSPASLPRSLEFLMFSLSIRKPKITSSQASMTLTIRIAADIFNRLIP